MDRLVIAAKDKASTVRASETGRPPSPPRSPAERADVVPVLGLVLGRADGVIRRSSVDVLGGTRIPAGVLDVLRRRAGAGRPLPSGLAEEFGPQLGSDLSRVRVHNDHEADAVSRSVQATAFSYGTDMYFSRGSFDPGSATGRHLLAHELAHVTDRSATVGPDHLIGRADDPAEARAAATADRVIAALRRRAVQTPGESVSETSTILPTGVRRKIGFEFETPWTLKAPGNLIGSDTAVITGSVGRDKERTELWHASPDMKAPTDSFGNVLPEYQAKTTTVPHPLLGFLGVTETVTQLPKYTGYGNLEFITEAFEENDAGFKKMSRAVRSIVDLVSQLSQPYPGDIPLGKMLNIEVAWGEFVKDKPANKDIVVDTRPTDNATDKKRLWASIQMTGGIKLDQLPKLLTALARQGPDSARLLHRSPEAMVPKYDAMVVAVNTVLQKEPGVYVGTLNKVQRDTYVGAIAHLVSIVKFAAECAGADQAKYASPLLSRTDFGKLPDYVRNSPDFAKHVITAGGVAGTAKLFALSPLLWQGTVAEWLTGIVNGSDPINWGQDKNDERWQPQEVGDDGDRATGHVYEFRALKGRLYVADWVSTAEDLFGVVRAVNRSKV